MNQEDKLEKLKAYLSNERTMLSYIRTSASVMVLAVALIKFFDNESILYLGIFILIVGFLISFLGVYRYRQEKNRINKAWPKGKNS